MPKGGASEGGREARTSGEKEAGGKAHHGEIKTTSLQLSKDGIAVVLSQRGSGVSRHSKKVKKSKKKSKERASE